jgi:hypothetical protein
MTTPRRGTGGPSGFPIEQQLVPNVPTQTVATVTPLTSSVFTANTLPRIYIQNLLTGKWLHRDVRIQSPSITRGMNGADQFSCNITPVDPTLQDSTGNPIVEEWRDAIYIEEGNNIKWGGLLTQSTFNGPNWNIQANGFSSYPNGRTYYLSYSQTNIDILDVVRELWRYVQSVSFSNIGMVVDTTKSGVKLGNTTESVSTSTTSASGVSTTTTTNQIVPYTLDWSNSVDCGQEISNLAEQCPFDFTEYHAWTDATKTAVNHRLALKYPRLGVRQQSLRFVEGENIIQPPQITRDGTSYANYIEVLGAGTGTSTKRSYLAISDGHLRRDADYQDQTLSSDAACATMASSIMPSYNGLDTVSQIIIKDHPHARFGSFDVGDDILVQVGSYWRTLSVWSRITSYTQDPTTNQMTLQLSRSDSFSYQPATGTAGTG